MSSSFLLWVLAGMAAAAAAAGGAWWWYRRKKQLDMLTHWDLASRPLFSADERLVYRQLCEALPHHVVLAKVPLVRFCRPQDPAQVSYWHQLLSTIYVTFAVCTPNGQVLAALDVESPRRMRSRSLARIKQEALRACRIRYVKCRADQLPNIAELQMLVPRQGLSGRADVPDTVDSVRKVRPTLAHTLRARGSRRPVGAWSDSFIGSDSSSFAPDSRIEEPAARPAGDARAPKVPPAVAPVAPLSERALRLFFAPGNGLQPDDSVH